MRFSPPRRKAFTLVELLVVIGIISLLIGILLPVLSKARKEGNWAVCLSNMKQIGNALTMYGNDNRSYLPRPASGTLGAFPDDFVNWSAPPGGYAPPPGYPGTAQAWWFNQTALARYLNCQDNKLASLFRCPSDNWADRRSAYRYSYTMNDEWSAWTTATTSTPPPYAYAPWGTPNRQRRSMIGNIPGPRPKLINVVQPSKKILVVEARNPDDGLWGHDVGHDDLTSRHSNASDDPNSGDFRRGQGNILFTDMHAARTSREQIMDPAPAKTYEQEYWDPFN